MCGIGHRGGDQQSFSSKHYNFTSKDFKGALLILIRKNQMFHSAVHINTISKKIQGKLLFVYRLSKPFQQCLSLTKGQIKAKFFYESIDCILLGEKITEKNSLRKNIYIV